jgi:hypothetical protein
MDSRVSDREKTRKVGDGYITKMCRKCNKKEDVGSAFKVCGRCKTSRYCSKECQSADWPLHKTQCESQQELLTQAGGKRAWQSLQDSAFSFGQNRYVDIAREMRKTKLALGANMQDMIVFLVHASDTIPIYNPFSIVTMNDMRNGSNLPSLVQQIFEYDENRIGALATLEERRASLTQGMILLWVMHSGTFSTNLFRLELKAPDFKTFLYTDEIIASLEVQNDVIRKFWPTHPSLPLT